MKRDWIVCIACLGIFSVVLVLLSQVSHSQIRNCKSPTEVNLALLTTTLILITVTIRDARLRILT